MPRNITLFGCFNLNVVMFYIKHSFIEALEKYESVVTLYISIIISPMGIFVSISVYKINAFIGDFILKFKRSVLSVLTSFW